MISEFTELISTAAFRRFWIGRHAEAEPLFLRALAMRERLLGARHPSTADTAARLAIMYDHHPIDGDPEPYYHMALAGYEEAYDGAHPDLFQARYRLADYLHRQGRADEAGSLFEQLVTVLDMHRPTIDLNSVHWMLGGCCEYLRDRGREAEARSIEEWAAPYHPLLAMSRAEVERAELAFGPDSLEVALKLHELSNSYVVSGQAELAEHASRRFWRCARPSSGPTIRLRPRPPPIWSTFAGVPSNGPRADPLLAVSAAAEISSSTSSAAHGLTSAGRT
jgi:hypothetical protein